MKDFQDKFKKLDSAITQIKVPTERILNKDILSIIHLINEDKFELKLIDEIFNIVQSIF